ncbi:SPOR domain-containing protein [Sphingorhabdus sp.]|uniref:SPOR domain-containing protein n=1 Tax=Sphingorhabdus sp. TaxID=1902408 RepID=UPI0039831486
MAMRSDVKRSDVFTRALAALAIMAGAVPAYADTKTGIEAWARGEYEVAVKEWLDPAMAGDPDAQFNIGEAYKLGRGVKTNLNVALDWYRKAAAQGHLQAADSVGHLLHYQQKIAEALPYLRASSDRGEPRAQYLLATEMFNGIHVEKDWVRAYALMTRASLASLGSASRSLAKMNEYIPADQRKAGTALAAEFEQSTNRGQIAQAENSPINTRPVIETAAPVALPPSTAVVADPAPVASQMAADPVWRIQLGAFGNADNAQKLWTKITRNVTELAELKPIISSNGNITRLQTGPFRNKADADAICKKVKAAGQQCLSVATS